MENRLTGLEALKAKTLNEIERMRAEVARAREDSGKAFPQSSQLAAARERAREIERRLEEAAKSQHQEQPYQSVDTAAGEGIGQPSGAVRISRSDFPESVRLSEPVGIAATQSRLALPQEPSARPVR